MEIRQQMGEPTFSHTCHMLNLWNIQNLNKWNESFACNTIIDTFAYDTIIDTFAFTNAETLHWKQG